MSEQVFEHDKPLTVIFGDNLEVLATLPDATFDLIYIDPPFNTGVTRRHTQLKTVRDQEGDRVGFQGKRYRTVALGKRQYADIFDDYIDFIEPRLREAHRLLKPDGSLFFHIDYREAHYCKVLLDGIFGRDAFMNEIIWAYDYGARTKKRWSAKHDTIFWYARNPKDYHYDVEAADRIPYMAPGLVGPEKAARGKIPTDTWWHTIVSPNARERTGYPTQKPRGVIDRIVKVHSAEGDLLMDFFAGSGTFGESAMAHGRRCVLVDQNPDAMEVMGKRFAGEEVRWVNWDAGGVGD